MFHDKVKELGLLTGRVQIDLAWLLKRALTAAPSLINDQHLWSTFISVIQLLHLAMSKYAPWKRTSTNPAPSSSTICQKCLGTGEYFVLVAPLSFVSNMMPVGHFTYQCKGSRPYISRPSRTQMLENPRVLAKLKADGKPSVEVPEEFKKKYVLIRAVL